MRFLFGAILALLVAWSGYWFAGQRYIEGQIGTVLAGGMPAGFVVEQSGYNVAGFPSRFDLTVTKPRLSDAVTGWGWRAEFAQVFAMTWKPWHLIAALPHTQEIDTPFGPATLGSDRFMASLRVEPSAAAALGEVVLEIEAATLVAPTLPPVKADKLIFALRQEVAQEYGYRLGLGLENLSPMIAAPSGGNLLAGRLDAVLSTTAALDRFAAQTRPELIGVDLQSLSLDWGAVSLIGSGKVEGNADGFAEGEIALKVTGWRDLPKTLVDFGMIQPEIVKTVALGLELIAEEQGFPEVLDLPVRFKSGRSYLGPLPIGTAPMMVQRQ